MWPLVEFNKTILSEGCEWSKAACQKRSHLTLARNDDVEPGEMGTKKKRFFKCSGVESSMSRSKVRASKPAIWSGVLIRGLEEGAVLGSMVKKFEGKFCMILSWNFVMSHEPRGEEKLIESKSKPYYKKN